MQIRRKSVLRLVQVALLGQVASGVLLSGGQREKCSCNDCQAVLKRAGDGESLLQISSVEAIDQRLVCERSDGNLTHRCSNSCARDCRATLPKKMSKHISCEANHGTPRVAKGLSLSQLSVAYKLMAGCPEPKPCMCQCNCPPMTYGTPLPPPPLPPFATLTPPELSVGLLQVPTGVPPSVVNSLMHGRTMSGMFTAAASALTGFMEVPPPKPPQYSPVSLVQVDASIQNEGQAGTAVAAGVFEAGFPGNGGKIILGPPPPPAPPLPPPVARGACPKSAGCNCYCPCRDEAQR